MLKNRGLAFQVTLPRLLRQALINECTLSFRRVRIFAAEKGIELSLEEVDILAGQSRTPEFLAKNSSGGVAVLELDNGSYLSEPNLLGRDLREQAEIERWNRRMELELFAAIGRTVQNTSPIFQGRFKQFPDYGARTDGSRAERAPVRRGGPLHDRRHYGIGGNRYGGRLADIKIAPKLAYLTRWHELVSSRPSAKA
jgi:glutathione S-transferase